MVTPSYADNVQVASVDKVFSSYEKVQVVPTGRAVWQCLEGWKLSVDDLVPVSKYAWGVLVQKVREEYTTQGQQWPGTPTNGGEGSAAASRARRGGQWRRRGRPLGRPGPRGLRHREK